MLILSLDHLRKKKEKNNLCFGQARETKQSQYCTWKRINVGKRITVHVGEERPYHDGTLSYYIW